LRYFNSSLRKTIVEEHELNLNEWRHKPPMLAEQGEIISASPY